MKPMVFDQWWPKELGHPSTAGAQNGVRYAFFPERRRLLVERAGHLTTYDTGEHRIGGVSSQQQNGGEASLMFSSQHGPIRLEQLPIENEQPRPANRDPGARDTVAPLDAKSHDAGHPDAKPHDAKPLDAKRLDAKPLDAKPWETKHNELRHQHRHPHDERGRAASRDDRPLAPPHDPRLTDHRGSESDHSPSRDTQLRSGERVVFSEEGAASSVVKLIVKGDIDIDMIEAVEDYLRRQKRRLTRG